MRRLRFTYKEVIVGIITYNAKYKTRFFYGFYTVLVAVIIINKLKKRL